MSEQETDKAREALKTQPIKVEELPAADMQPDEVKGGSGSSVWTGVVRSS